MPIISISQIKEKCGAYSREEILNIYEGYFKKPIKRVKAAIVKYGLERKKTIDVGCAYGHCLINFGSESVGIEIDPVKVKFAEALGLNVIEFDLNNNGEIPLQDEAYDAIWVSDILEHLDSPHKILMKLRKKLKPNGLLIAYVTTLPKSLLSRILWKKLLGYEGYESYTHFYQWTSETASFLIERGGSGLSTDI